MVLNWKLGGLLLGLVFLAAVTLLKPIGVSTQFFMHDGIVWNAIDSDAYLDKSSGKYAKNASNPLNHSFVFAIAMVAGAGLSALLRGGVREDEKCMPKVWRANFGDCKAMRYIATFAAGF